MSCHLCSHAVNSFQYFRVKVPWFLVSNFSIKAQSMDFSKKRSAFPGKELFFPASYYIIKPQAHSFHPAKMKKLGETWRQGHPRWYCWIPMNIFWLVVGPPLWKIWKSIGMIRNPISSMALFGLDGNALKSLSQGFYNESNVTPRFWRTYPMAARSPFVKFWHEGRCDWISHQTSGFSDCLASSRVRGSGWNTNQRSSSPVLLAKSHVNEAINVVAESHGLCRLLGQVTWGFP